MPVFGEVNEVAWRQGRFLEDLLESEVFLVDLRTALSMMEVAETDSVIEEIISALANDLDTPAALNSLKAWSARSIVGASGGSPGELSRAIDSLLGIAI